MRNIYTNKSSTSSKNQPRGKISKPRNGKATLLRLFSYIGAYRTLLIIGIFLALAGNLFALIGPMLSGKAIDAITLGIGKVNFPSVYFYAALMVVCYILSAVISYALALLMLYISQKVVKRLRNDVFSKLTVLPVSYFDHNMSGEIISKISYDIDVISTSLSTDVVQIVASLITIFVSFIMMIIISPVLVLVMLVTIPMALIYTRYMAKKTRPLFHKRSLKLGEMNGFIEEMVSGQKTIKAYAREDITVQKYDFINHEAVNAYYDAEYYSSMTGPTVNFINNVSLSLVTMFGAILYLFGHLSLGNISSFILYSRKFSGPINEMANIITELQSSLAAAERIFNLLDETSEPIDSDHASELDTVEGNVRFNDITFGYTKEKIILKNLSLSAKKGSLIAIVGPTGAGKTTIINLLMRFYDPQSGEISIDNKDSKDLTRESLRKAFAMVLQDTWIFHGTIFENIAYGKENTTLDEVISVAKAAKIHSYIMRLPMGYDTLLSEDGMNISKGQLQLITIARAMLLDAKMLILDEATSNVDTHTEQQIQKAMRKLMADKTCFVIAHRLSTIQHADLILVVDQGNIVEQGSHETLMEGKGFYYNFYISQFK